jgi:four helix bundle protein
MKPSSYDDWLKRIPPEITGDALWQMTLYRQALFLGELAWFDVCGLAQDRRTRTLSDQLYRSVGSINANISEGYSRASKKDQARFYEYALGSARETRDWYYKGRHVLGDDIALHRLRLLVHIIRQLLKLVPETRGRSIREEPAHYETHPIQTLLANIPIPET